MSSKKSVGHDEKKFTLVDFLFRGFSYIVGVSFLGLCTLCNSSVGPDDGYKKGSDFGM
jgi:hypothetical protein